MKMIARQDGFTLAELTVGMALTAIIMAALFGIFSVSVKSYQYGFAQERVYDEGRRAINALTGELRYATVTIPPANNPTAYNGSGNSPMQITYTTPAGSNRSITYSTNTITINSTPYAQGMVQSVSFQRDPADLPPRNKINIELKLAYTYQGKTEAMTFTTSVLTGTKF